MQSYFKSSIGRLRLIGILEGLSLILLVFIAVPLKYIYNQPEYVRALGMCHGILFLLFVYSVYSVASEYNWKFREITCKLLLSSVIPFGTFYVDSKILKDIAV
jgi:integral membrane protein